MNENPILPSPAEDSGTNTTSVEDVPALGFGLEVAEELGNHIMLGEETHTTLIRR
jgi:hypothetical protein